MTHIPGKPYSLEFLVENRKKIYAQVTNKQLITALEDVAAALEGRGLPLNAAPIREAMDRIQRFNDYFITRSDGINS